jgi:hypothetical protein
VGLRDLNDYSKGNPLKSDNGDGEKKPANKDHRNNPLLCV